MFRTDGKIHIDWRWVGIGYCCFVVFQLLPVIIIRDLLRGFKFNVNANGYSMFMVLLVGGLFLVSIIIPFSIGFRSKGMAIFESGISTVLYFITLVIQSLGNASHHFTLVESIGIYLFVEILLFSLAMAFAWVGTYVHARKARRVAAQNCEV
jgi:hypothetical protein